MSIWFKTPDIAELKNWSRKTAVERLGIEIIDIGTDYIKGTMPVDHRTYQPMGMLHGGSSALFAETLGSFAANYCVDRDKYYCVGLEINANHLRGVREGIVFGIAKPLHIGKSTQVWDIQISNEKGKLVCVARLTMAVLAR